VRCEGWACGLSDASIAGCGATRIRDEYDVSPGNSVFRLRDRATNDSVYFESGLVDPRLCARDAAGKARYQKFWSKSDKYATPIPLVVPGSKCEIRTEASLEGAKRRCDEDEGCKGFYGPGPFALTNAMPGSCALDWRPGATTSVSATSADSCARFFGKGFGTDPYGRCVAPASNCPPGWEPRGGACRPVCDPTRMGTPDGGKSEHWCRWANGPNETTWGCPVGFEYTRSGMTDYCVPTRGAVDASLLLAPLVAGPADPARTDAECDGWVCGVASKSLLECRATTPYTPDAVSKGNYNSVFRTNRGTFLSEAVDPRVCAVREGKEYTYTKKHTVPSTGASVFLAADRKYYYKSPACEIDTYLTADKAERACSASPSCAGYYSSASSAQMPHATASADPEQCRVDWRPIENKRASCTRFLGSNYADGARRTDACRRVSNESSTCPFGWAGPNAKSTGDHGPCSLPCSSAPRTSGKCTWEPANSCKLGLEFTKPEKSQSVAASLPMEDGKVFYTSDECIPNKRAIDATMLLTRLVPPYQP
jgi:hypothetical protein